MTPRLLTKDEQTIVVFSIWQSLPYHNRLILSICLLAIGFLVQAVLYSFSGMLLGLVFLAAANSLMLVKGYTNALTFDSYNPSAAWEKVDRATFKKLRELHQAMERWDRSAVDITNPLGVFTFIIAFLLAVSMFFLGLFFFSLVPVIISADILILVIPHWFSGIRSIQSQKGLLRKLDLLEGLVNQMDDHLKNHAVDFFMLLQGKDSKKMPQDAKIRVNIANQSDDFLGLYGQLVMNMVNSTAYPYFYTVIVVKPVRARQLQKLRDTAPPTDQIIHEYKVMADVSVLVIRQVTTETSGYHTTDSTMKMIFQNGISLAEKIAPL